ncbi:hypothetical protein ScPMuIL_018231 [Solemya velum]
MGKEYGDQTTEKPMTMSMINDGSPGRLENQHNWAAIVSDVASVGSCSATSTLQKGNLSSPSSPRTVISLTSAASENCRICSDNDTGERLISPCYCTGSVGVVHLSCLEKWLGSSNNTRCELCFCDFSLQRRTRPFREFLRAPGDDVDKRSLVCDFVCFAILTPLTIGTTWLCMTGAVTYAKTKWEIAGITGLNSSLILLYLIWLTVILRHNIRLWHAWSKYNQIVSLTYTIPRTRKHQTADADRSVSNTQCSAV